MMKFYKIISTALLLCIFSAISLAQINFSDYFTENTAMRLDYYHAGTFDSEIIYFKEIKAIPHWSQSKNSLIDKFEYGKYYFKLFDKTSNELIFSQGFCTLFGEWQHTPEARVEKKNISLPESLVFPFPKNDVVLKIYSRDNKTNLFEEIFQLDISPSDIRLNKESTKDVEYRKIHYSCNSEKALDLVFIGDGYTKAQIEDFYNDVKSVSDYLLKTSPFDKYKDEINIWAIGLESQESGTDIPQNNIWKSTALSSSFYTFGSERYLTSIDYHNIRDYADIVPCDQICILVNTEVYGGGGIYNFWNLTAAKHAATNEVFVHEIGHALVALADEYYYADGANETATNKSVEPYEPNITTLVEFDKKWKNMMDKNTKIPTEINEENVNTIGVYEGASYCEKDVYRPYIECKMKNLYQEFCPVCSKHIQEIIETYTK